jgi:hypothetical protein
MFFACSKSFSIKRIISSVYCKMEMSPSIRCDTRPVICPSSLALDINKVTRGLPILNLFLFESIGLHFHLL